MDREHGEDTTANREIFTFMPVPASDHLLLEYKAKANFTVDIYTVTGQKMTTLNMRGGNSNQNINIDAYTTGIYYYEIERDKVVLQRGDLFYY